MSLSNDTTLTMPVQPVYQAGGFGGWGGDFGSWLILFLLFGCFGVGVKNVRSPNQIVYAGVVKIGKLGQYLDGDGALVVFVSGIGSL